MADRLRALRLRRARARGRHTHVEWYALVKACADQCVRCGATEYPLERDHIVPLYQGGSDALDNIQPLCARCNASKGAESIDHRPEGWRTRVAAWSG